MCLISKCPDYAVDLVYFREVDCVYKSTFGLSFVGRFVLVLYWRFHYNGTNQEFTFHCCPNFWIPELFEGPTNCSNYSPSHIPLSMYVVHEDMGFKSVDSVREIKEGVYNVCGVKHSPETLKFCAR